MTRRDASGRFIKTGSPEDTENEYRFEVRFQTTRNIQELATIWQGAILATMLEGRVVVNLVRCYLAKKDLL